MMLSLISRSAGDDAAHTDDRMGDPGFLDLAAFSQEHILQLAVLHDRTGQKTGVGINRAFTVKEVERWIWAGQLKIGLIERADGADIPPVTIEIETIDGPVADGMRDDVSTEIVKTRIVIQQIDQHLGIEEVNSH